MEKTYSLKIEKNDETDGKTEWRLEVFGLTLAESQDMQKGLLPSLAEWIEKDVVD